MQITPETEEAQSLAFGDAELLTEVIDEVSDVHGCMGIASARALELCAVYL